MVHRQWSVTLHILKAFSTAEQDLARCIVPHGGFVTSCFLSTASLHFSTTHARRNQPHTITLHLTFLRRTSVGPAHLCVRDVKLGKRTSTVHISLAQASDASTAEPSVVGYLTQSNLCREQGLSLPTKWSLHPPPPPRPSFQSLELGTANANKHWTLSPPLHPRFRKAANRVRFYLPRHGQLEPGMADEWIRFAHPGARFTQESLGFVADQFPQIVEIYPDADADVARGSPDGGKKEPNWYPTVVLNLDVKKCLPAEGAEWLFVRVRAKKIENGRMDLEVVVLDEGGALVAVSNHVCLILGAERNMARGGIGDGNEKASKM
ncbi:MAG: hypothetical protein LQ344_003057 [Seirophora lacunosa]|nr:MAG: hypothetical protein LQ344_003057 [Seirophora lacunosa]